jgi:Tfp pilus assembly protein PilO
MLDNFKLQKQVILAVLGILFIADMVLAVYTYRQNSSPHTPQQVLAQQNRQLELQRADIKRARGIRERIPAIQKGFDQFEASLLPASKGYSSLASEFGDIAGKAGVKVEEVRFHQKEVPTRGLSEVEIESTISGEYANVVRFLNGMQRSQNVYAVESLALAQGDASQNPSGILRVNLHMKTYFRTAG